MNYYSEEEMIKRNPNITSSCQPNSTINDGPFEFQKIIKNYQKWQEKNADPIKEKTIARINREGISALIMKEKDHHSSILGCKYVSRIVLLRGCGSHLAYYHDKQSTKKHDTKKILKAEEYNALTYLGMQMEPSGYIPIQEITEVQWDPHSQKNN